MFHASLQLQKAYGCDLHMTVPPGFFSELDESVLAGSGRTGGRVVAGNISARGFPVSSAMIRATSLVHV